MGLGCPAAGLQLLPSYHQGASAEEPGQARMRFSGQIRFSDERQNAVLSLIKSARSLICGSTCPSGGPSESESMDTCSCGLMFVSDFISQKAQKKYRSEDSLETVFVPLNWLCCTHALAGGDGCRGNLWSTARVLPPPSASCPTRSTST